MGGIVRVDGGDLRALEQRADLRVGLAGQREQGVASACPSASKPRRPSVRPSRYRRRLVGEAGRRLRALRT